MKSLGYCEDLYCDEEWKGIEQVYWEQEPPPLRSEVARAIRQTASRKATGPAVRQQDLSYRHVRMPYQLTFNPLCRRQFKSTWSQKY